MGESEDNSGIRDNEEEIEQGPRVLRARTFEKNSKNSYVFEPNVNEIYEIERLENLALEKKLLMGDELKEEVSEKKGGILEFFGFGKKVQKEKIE